MSGIERGVTSPPLCEWVLLGHKFRIFDEILRCMCVHVSAWPNIEMRQYCVMGDFC